MSKIRNELYVDIDWGSSGIWSIEDGRGYVNDIYGNFDLPDWLVKRFQYWTGWYNCEHQPGDINEKMDWESFNAYGLSLAVDLKRVVGDKYKVFWWADSKVPREQPKEMFLPDEKLVWDAVPSE